MRVILIDNRPGRPRHSSSNTAAPPASPGRVFADSLIAVKAFANQGQDNDDLNLQEDDIKRKKHKSKGKMMVVNKDEEDDNVEDEEEDNEEEDLDDEQDEEDISDGDDEELSTEAVDKLMKVICSRKKQKYSLSKKQSNPEHLPGHFKKWGCHAHCLCGVYTNIFKTITTGMMVLKSHPKTAEEFAQSYKAVPNMSAATAKFYTQKFMYLCDRIPKLKALCGHLFFRMSDMFVFAKFFKKHAAAGRSSDISTLKRNFASYLPRVTVSTGVVVRPLMQVEYANKSRNGSYYLVCTGRLVLLIHERDSFDEDPVMYNKFKANEHKAFVHQNKRRKTDRTSPDDKSYPGFLFPSCFDYNEQSPQRGIFKNTLCELVVRHWLKGPSSVGLSDGAPNLRRTCLADIYDITKLTPDYLAYAATLIRHLLSVDGRWSGDDKRQTGHRLHMSLHRLLTVDYEAWEEDIESGDLDNDGMNWMNENIFSYYNRIIFESEEGDPEEQAVDGSDYDNDNDNANDDNLRVRMAELEENHQRRKLRILPELPQQPAPRFQLLDYVNAVPPAIPDISDLHGDADTDVQVLEDS
ncbi:hypothetical protein LXA43DRAFT_1063027 [Ganoderma leucocontextum]|nr:hypothetical protein LXA43DRAFT_1063027 [Ganoderma leucocontextum]